MTVLDLAEHMERVRERQACPLRDEYLGRYLGESVYRSFLTTTEYDMLLCQEAFAPGLQPSSGPPSPPTKQQWDASPAAKVLREKVSGALTPSHHYAIAQMQWIGRPIGNHAAKTPVTAFIPELRPEPSAELATQSVPGTAATKKNRLLARRVEEALR